MDKIERNKIEDTHIIDYLCREEKSTLYFFTY